MVGVIGSVIGVLDDSPFSDFVADLFILFLGAMEMVFESMKKEGEREDSEDKTESVEVREQRMRFTHYKRSIVQCICTSIRIDWTT